MHFFKLIVANDIEQLEHNPRTQFSVNRSFLVFWLCNMPIVVLLEFLFRRYWLEISATYIAESTIWGVVATHFGAMSSALAAIGTRKQQQTALDSEPVMAAHPVIARGK